MSCHKKGRSQLKEQRLQDWIEICFSAIAFKLTKCCGLAFEAAINEYAQIPALSLHKLHKYKADFVCVSKICQGRKIKASSNYFTAYKALMG